MILQLINEYKDIYSKGRLENRVELDDLYDMAFTKEKELFDMRGFVDSGNCSALIIDQKGIYGCFEGFSNHEVKMYLDPIDKAAVANQLLIQGFYESEEMSAVNRILRYMDKDSVIFDIGANLGWYGINISKLLPDSKVYFFEPVPETIARLKNNLMLNDIDTQRVCSCGLYSQNTKSKFYYDVIASGASSLANLKERETTRVIEVELRRMDDIVREFGINRLDFIKMDVEGAELYAIQGGEKTIESKLPVVFTEMLRKWAQKQGYHPNDIIDLMESIGYECFVISGDKLKRFYKVDKDTIETNYFFLHKEKHVRIIAEMTYTL